MASCSHLYVQMLQLDEAAQLLRQLGESVIVDLEGFQHRERADGRGKGRDLVARQVKVPQYLKRERTIFSSLFWATFVVDTVFFSI